MAYYVKVKPAVRDRLLPSYITGTKAADGNVILFQSDLNSVDGLTLSDRVSVLGGALLTPQQAKQEIDGTCVPSICYDPEANESNPEENESDPEENSGNPDGGDGTLEDNEGSLEGSEDKPESEVNNG